MFIGYGFQIDIDEENRQTLVDSLQRVFGHSIPSNPAALAESVEQVIGEINVVDHNEREGSPWRNRPLRHFMPDQEPRQEMGDWKKPVHERPASTPAPSWKRDR